MNTHRRSRHNPSPTHPMFASRTTARSIDPHSVHAAAADGNLTRLKQLVSGTRNDQALHAMEDMLKMTPLHFAAEHGHLEVVQFLLESHVEVNSGDATATTPLHLASVMGHASIIRALLRAGAVATLQDSQGDTALHWAATKGHTEVIELLLAAKSPVDCVNKAGWTSLHRAAFNGRTAACKLLTARGASLQIVTHDGNTALHLAASGNHLGAMDVLIQGGASTIMANKAGQLPLDACISDGGRDLIASATARGTQHPLRQDYVRTQTGTPPASDRPSVSRETPAASSARAPASSSTAPVEKKQGGGFGFPMEETILAIPSSATHNKQAQGNDDPTSPNLFSYVSAVASRPGTGEAAGSSRISFTPQDTGRPSSARKLVEGLRASGAAATTEGVSPWDAVPSHAAGVGMLPSADDFQEAVRQQSRQQAAADALLNPAAREQTNKKFLDKYNLNRLNLFAP